jgi:transaldolase
MQNQLEQLKSMTIVVADTGDISAIERYQPIDSTTNPSLIYKAAQLEQYKPLLQDCIAHHTKPDGTIDIENTIHFFTVKLGVKILTIIPGKISTEVNARLSFDTEKMIAEARKLIALYEQHHISRDRILIKVAATWEGIEAARILQQENINCNLTLIFNFHQALAAAQANAYLISPFVGRILDWHKNKNPDSNFSAGLDPGVQSVSAIFQHFKQYQYETIVMGASFRNIEEIQQLAGCDRLTISPELMNELQQCHEPLEQKLNSKKAKSHFENIVIDQKSFRWHLNQDAMATEKLAEGIRNFSQDQEKLEQFINKLLA